jgi:hypothetical protein
MVKNFPFSIYTVQTAPMAHRALCKIGNVDSLEELGCRVKPITHFQLVLRSKNVDLHTDSSARLHKVEINHVGYST